jgi:signal transduction histidine kinase
VLANLKILKTSTFRLAAIYLLLFLLSMASLLAYVYYNTVGLLERQTEDTIRAEVLAIGDQYRMLGMPGILDVVKRRSLDANGSLYSLVSPNNVFIAGNIINLPSQHIADGAWVDFPVLVGKGESAVSHMARGYHVELTGDYELLVARDIHELRQFGELIRKTLLLASAMALVLGLGGGLLLSRNFLRRVDAITNASHTIMAGNLSSRMPISGSGDELDRLAKSLNDMLSQIERLMIGMKDVTSNVAHDLKTPLTRMRARVEAALRNTDSAEYRGALDQTIEECDGLLKTFNALLSIAQAEAGQARQNLQALDLNETLGDVVELYEPLAEEAGGKITYNPTPNLHVLGDRQLLAQAINNLIDNALKYGETHKPPEINVSSRIEKSEIIICVEDRGPGIPENDKTRVTDRFVRLDQSRSKPGNGLGLSLVSSIMTLHGGKLVLEDNNPGLKAVLHVPLALPSKS